MITIVDYGVGNLGSLLNMFNFLRIKAKIESDVKNISRAKKLILPGVGAFDTAMKKINEVLGLRSVLNEHAVIHHTPILGVCLGMQLMMNGSEEGKLPGFGWIEGSAHKFPHTRTEKVPHVGWNMAYTSKSDPITEALPNDPRYYFSHSYYVKVKNEHDSLLSTNYGITFDSGVRRNNIIGVQFHPEKSHKFGMALLKNFDMIK